MSLNSFFFPYVAPRLTPQHHIYAHLCSYPLLSIHHTVMICVIPDALRVRMTLCYGSSLTHRTCRRCQNEPPTPRESISLPEPLSANSIHRARLSPSRLLSPELNVMLASYRAPTACSLRCLKLDAVKSDEPSQPRTRRHRRNHHDWHRMHQTSRRCLREMHSQSVNLTQPARRRPNFAIHSSRDRRAATPRSQLLLVTPGEQRDTVTVAITVQSTECVPCCLTCIDSSA